MSIEHDLNCAIISEEDYRDIVALGIKPEFFIDPVERRVFELISDHLLEYRKVPGIDAVRLGFPSYAYIHTDEPVAFYADKLTDNHIRRLVMAGITEMSETFDDALTTGRELKNGLDQVLYRANLSAAEGSVADTLSTQREYYDVEMPLRKKLGYLRGYTTGFDDLDRAIGGYQKGQLITLFGLAKHGKSTLMLASALRMKRAGIRSLFVTFEMGVGEQRDRLASLQTSLSLTKIMNGALTYNEEQAFSRALALDEGLQGLAMIEDTNSMLTVAGVNQKIIEINPQVIFIDGVYWMDSPGDPKSNEAITYLTKHLKRLARNHNIPIVISSQALPSRSRGGLTANSIGYSAAFQQDSDHLIGVYKLTPTLSEFQVLLTRTGRNVSLYLRIDWDRGYIEQEDEAVALAEIGSRNTSGPKGNFSGHSGKP
jgi:replicative DNA helicase